MRSIRIRFMLNGKRMNERLDMPPTPPNLKYAARVAEDIRRAIAAGTFVYADFFPGSPRAEHTAGAMTVKDAGDKWLRAQGRLAGATLSQYRNDLNLWYRQIGATRTMGSIKATELEAIVGGYPWPSPKRCNNALTPLRGLTSVAYRDGATPIDIASGIKSSELQQPTPDPLTLAEAEAILEDVRKHYSPQVYNYFDFAFYTGMRPEEIVALKWDDIDWRLKIARVQRAKSFRGQLKSVKGYKTRDVELSSRAVTALERQREHTFMKKHADESLNGFIFENPVTGRPWYDARAPRENYWTPALKRTGIRYRTPYHTRHTYATAMIMGGSRERWLARQLGNSPAMIRKHYTTWLDHVDEGRQRAQQEIALGLTKPGPQLVHASGNAGRRDWDRTNTPGDSSGSNGKPDE